MRSAHRQLMRAGQALVCIMALLSNMVAAETACCGDAPQCGESALHIDTQLVVVDVTVQDSNGRPIHGLKRDDFTVTENNRPRTIEYFEEDSSQLSPQTGPALPPLPPGTFTDYTAVPPSGALNVLLLDTLNTPMADQAYVRNQLRQFVKKVKPGTRIAILGLSQRLYMLQGFSSDPQILRNVVEHKLLPRGSSLLGDQVSTGNTPEAATDLVANFGSEALGAGGMQIASTLQQFETEQQSFQTQLRIRYTLDAFNALAHYLSAFSGRKNLIWFSGSFPINILPDPAMDNSFALMEDSSPEFRETTDLLSRAQVAVYPVDARGLMTDPTFSAAATMRGTQLNANQPGKSSLAFYQSQVSEHMTMSQLAEDTGGRAFYDTNDLATAVQSAIESGTNYYTLMYSPAETSWNGAYREVGVKLNNSLKDAGFLLAYRHGYYADAPNETPKESRRVSTTMTSTAPANGGNVYMRATMAHGAPTPEDILFKVRVLPIGSVREETLASANVVDPAHPIKAPFRRFALDIAAVGSDFRLEQKSDGRHTGSMEFSVFLYDNDGRLLNATGKTVELNLTPEAYKRFLSGVKAHFELSVPVKGGGNDFIRVGIHDIFSNRFGAVEIPVASVEGLPPLPLPRQ